MIEEAKEFIKTFDNIKYGWYDTKGVLREHIDKDYMIEYRTRSPKETKELNVGVCWDLNELQRDYYESKNANFHTIFAVINDLYLKHPNHAFVIVEHNGKFYWSEGTWRTRKGIHEYNSKEEILKDIKANFSEIYGKPLPEDKIENLEFFEYERPIYGLSAIDFFMHCIKGNKIN